MRWEEAVPQLRRRLAREGLPGPAQVVTRIPVRGYALLLGCPAVFLGGVVLAARPSFGRALGVIVVVAAFESAVVTCARASVVVAGPGWVAKHGLWWWRLVRLDSLGKVDTYDEPRSGRTYLRLWDTAGGHVALDARATVPKIRPMLGEAIAHAEASDTATVSPRAATMFGLPDPRPPDEIARARRFTDIAVGVGAALLILPLLAAGPAGILAGVCVAGVAVLVLRRGRAVRPPAV